METVNVTSLDEYLGQIEFLEETDLFRGIGNDNLYKLIPSAGRFGIKDPSVQRQFEEALFKDFKRKAHLYIQQTPKNDFEWLFLAQHHGLPTRLLDWTFNPLVALYFAVENEHDADCAIYRSYLSSFITPEQIEGWGSPFNIKEMTQIIPNLNHVRYQNQNGLFTIHPQPSKEDFTLIMTKYLISKPIKKAIRWKLRKIGISKSLLFQNLDSLTYDILQINKSKYDPYFRK